MNNKLEWDTSILLEKMSEDARNAYIKYSNIPKKKHGKESSLAQKIRDLFIKKSESKILNISKTNRNEQKFLNKVDQITTLKNNEILSQKDEDLSEMTEAESSENIKNDINDSKRNVRVFVKRNSFSHPKNIQKTLVFQKIPQISLDQELDF